MVPAGADSLGNREQQNCRTLGPLPPAVSHLESGCTRVVESTLLLGF